MHPFKLAERTRQNGISNLQNDAEPAEHRNSTNPARAGRTEIPPNHAFKPQPQRKYPSLNDQNRLSTAATRNTRLRPNSDPPSNSCPPRTGKTASQNGSERSQDRPSLNPPYAQAAAPAQRAERTFCRRAAGPPRPRNDGTRDADASPQVQGGWKSDADRDPGQPQIRNLPVNEHVAAALSGALGGQRPRVRSEPLAGRPKVRKQAGHRRRSGGHGQSRPGAARSQGAWQGPGPGPARPVRTALGGREPQPRRAAGSSTPQQTLASRRASTPAGRRHRCADPGRPEVRSKPRRAAEGPKPTTRGGPGRRSERKGPAGPGPLRSAQGGRGTETNHAGRPGP